MNMITIDRALVEQALDALEAALSDDQPYIERCKQTITALRASPQRKPLSSDKDRPDQGTTYVEGYGYVDTRAVRAIERALGIKE